MGKDVPLYVVGGLDYGAAVLVEQRVEDLGDRVQPNSHNAISRAS